MKILLIAPSDGNWKSIGKNTLFNGKTFRFSLLGLLTVAALTPPIHTIRLIDEQIEDIPFDEQYDLVGIGFMTALAPRAYEIARLFRARKIPVVFGGIHPTLCHEQAGQYADSVVIGKAEGAWERLLEDIQCGQLKAEYSSSQNQLSHVPFPRWELLDRDQYATPVAVQATRGCLHHCEFCSVSAFSNATHQQRPVHEVVEEVRKNPSSFFIFVDDNLTADRDYAISLFSALAPLNKKWVTQSTLRLADDDELLQNAVLAGCVGIFVGLETFSQLNLEKSTKSFHRTDQYAHAIGKLHKNGLGIEAGIVFGFEQDEPDVFASTLRMLDQLHVDLVQISILTPLPGTPLYQRYKERLLDHDLCHYDFHHVVFQPHKMSRAQLQDGHDWITREFYKPWRITRRLWRQARRGDGLASLGWVATLNFAYYGRVKRWGLKGKNPENGIERCLGKKNFTMKKGLYS